MPRIARWTLATGLALILLLTLATAGVAALLASESGTRWIAGLAVDRLGVGARWGELRGSLLGRLEVSDLDLEQPGFHLTAREVVVAWRPAALLQGTLEVDALTLADGVLTVRESEDEAPTGGAFNPGDIALPVNVSLRGASIRGLTVLLPGQPGHTVERLCLEAGVTGDRVDISAFEIRLPEGGLSLSGWAGLQEKMPIELTANVDGTLPLEAAAGSSPGARVSRDVSAALSLAGSIDWRSGIAAALSYGLSVQGIEGLVPDLPDSIAAMGGAEVSYGDDSLRIDAASLAIEEAGLSMQASGMVLGAASADPGFSVTLDWTGLRWPLAAAPPRLRSDDGHVSLEGRADDFSLAVRAKITGSDLPDARLNVRARGDTQQLRLEPLRAELLDGWVEVTGPVAFDAQPSWDLRITADDLDASTLVPELTAPVVVALNTRGRLDAGGSPSADVRIDELRTAASGFPVALEGAVRLEADVLQVGRLDVRSGTAELYSEGSLSPRDLDLDWKLSVADAGAFVPGARGRIDGGGRLTGSPEAPHLDMALTAEGLGQDTLAVETLTLELVAGLEGDAPLAGRLSAASVRDQDDVLLDQLAVALDGSTGDHRLTVTVDTPEARLNAGFEGGFSIADSTWQGTLQAIDAGSDALGVWSLEGPSPLSLSPEQVRLAGACLARAAGTGRLCLDGGWQSAGTASLDLELTALPVEAFVPTLTGELTGSVRAVVDAAGALAADGRVDLGSGVVRLPDDLDAQPLSHGGGRLAFSAGEDGLRAGADFAAPENGRVDLKLHLPEFNALPPASRQPLEGTVRAELPDLAILAALSEPVGQSAGQLSARLDLGGSLHAPLIDGELQLENGAVTLPIAGLDLREIELRLAHEAVNPELLTLSGGLRSGSGRLEATGFLNPVDGSAELRLAGEALRAYSTPDARVLVSPDLTLDWSGDLLRVRGLVNVPSAEITPRLRIGAATTESPAIGGQPGVLVGPSPDVVILGEEPQSGARPAGLEAPLRIDAEVGLVLGRDVSVNAVGLVSRLEGAIGFSLSPEQRDLVPVARGGISLVDGTFRSFGQDLDIETGQVLYAGVPVTEPEVFLRAVRWIDSDPTVSAVGVQLSGPGTAPELELFSRPPLDDTEIQSYLLTGTGTGENSTVVAIGTQLTERVYVGYGYNLLEETSEFDTLFTITPRYGLGADVGEADSNFNLMFTYEK